MIAAMSSAAYPHALASVRRNVMKYLACLDLPAFAQAVGSFAPDDAYAPARRSARS